VRALAVSGHCKSNQLGPSLVITHRPWIPQSKFFSSSEGLYCLLTCHPGAKLSGFVSAALSSGPILNKWLKVARFDVHERPECSYVTRLSASYRFRLLTIGELCISREKLPWKLVCLISSRSVGPARVLSMHPTPITTTGIRIHAAGSWI
jgi:hypothetical protein